jgi:polar amino acid transport system ATP-binding protein
MDIQIENLSKSFHGQSILKHVNLGIEEGKLTAIIGRSGCGKSTLLRCLNALEKLDDGSINIAGILLRPSQNFDAQALAVRQNVGMVFQSFNLFPHMSVIDNCIKPPMIVKSVSYDEAYETAIKYLDKVGLKTHIDKYPSELSGGQQQRAAIARALTMKPKVMLYDEPTSALDPELVDEVLQVMKDLDNEKMTQIVVTHEMRFALDASDTIVYMEEGNVVESGAPDKIFSKDADPKTQLFLRKFL